MIVGEAHAGADKWGDAIPGADVDIAVEEANERRYIGAIEIGELRGLRGYPDLLERLEMRSAAIFGSDVETQPIVDLITDADVEQGRGRNRRIVEAVEGVGGQTDQRVRAEVQINIAGLDAHPDVAAQIPAGIFQRRRLHWRGRRQ